MAPGIASAKVPITTSGDSTTLATSGLIRTSAARAVDAHPIVGSLASHGMPPRRVYRSLPVERLGERLRLRREGERRGEIAALIGAKGVRGERHEQHRSAPRQEVEPLPVVDPGHRVRDTDAIGVGDVERTVLRSGTMLFVS